MKQPFHCLADATEQRKALSRTSIKHTSSYERVPAAVPGRAAQGSEDTDPPQGRSAGHGSPTPPGTPQAASAHTCQPGVQDPLPLTHTVSQALRVNWHTWWCLWLKQENQSWGGTEVPTGVRGVGVQVPCTLHGSQPTPSAALFRLVPSLTSAGRIHTCLRRLRWVEGAVQPASGALSGCRPAQAPPQLFLPRAVTSAAWPVRRCTLAQTAQLR